MNDDTRLAPPLRMGRLMTKSNCFLARKSAKWFSSPPEESMSSNVHSTGSTWKHTYILLSAARHNGHYIYRTMLTISTAQWSLYLPPGLISNNHTAYLCVYEFLKMASIASHNINRPVLQCRCGVFSMKWELGFCVLFRRISDSTESINLPLY